MKPATKNQEPRTCNPVLDLWLPDYLAPSLNKTQGAHWIVAWKHKKAAARAILSALNDTPRGRSTRTTLPEAAKLLSIAYGKRAGSRTTPRTFATSKPLTSKAPGPIKARGCLFSTASKKA